MTPGAGASSGKAELRRQDHNPAQPDPIQPGPVPTSCSSHPRGWTLTCHHTRKQYPPGNWLRGTNEIPGLVLASNGTVQVKMRCNRCGHRTGPLPMHIVRAWGITADDYGWVKRNETVTYPPCIVIGCRETPTEWHHFAPRNTFTTEADNWPVLPLCIPHHQEWHRRMDGYRWQRKAAA